jgi:hypothetical protein
MSRRLGLAVGFVACSACVVSAPSTGSIQFDETVNLGYSCAGGLLSSWTVFNRETQKQGSATCQQPVLFTDMADGALYTFDITGYSPAGASEKPCWQGSCTVRAIGGRVTYADCSTQINHLCGY